MNEESSSEEKTLPPSALKLRKARRKGQVAQCREAAVSVVSLVAMAWLFTRQEEIAARLAALFEPEEAFEGLAFGALMERRLETLGALAFDVLLPFFVLIPLAVIVTNLAIMGGPVFAVEPLVPKFQKISPATGLKRLFGRRAMVTFLMHLVRMSALIAAIGAVIAGSLAVLLQAPICGLPCATEALGLAFRPLAIAAAAVLCAFMVFDILVQRSLFMREMRMSITERRRELKDLEGDPNLRGRLRSDRRSMIELSSGIDAATLLVDDGAARVVAVRYVDGETPAPLVVAKARNQERAEALRRAAECPSHLDAELATLLHQGFRIGDHVTEEALVLRLASAMQAAR